MKKIILILVIALTLTACSNVNKNEAGQNNLKKFTVLLDWTPNTNHTGLYVAKSKDFYKQEGLDVEIVSADGGNGLEMITNGKGDVAISFQEQVTLAKTSDNPLPVVAISTILQKNTSGFASLKDKNIKTAKDLEGKSYGSWGTDIETAFLKSIMQKNGADFNKINIKTINALDTLTMLKTEADFAWIYYGWDGIIAETKGNPLNFILLNEFDKDIEFYSPLLVASENTINNKSEDIKRFLRATKKGYEFSAKEPSKAAEILWEANKDLDINVLIKSQEYLKKYLLNEKGEWGIMDKKVWDNFTNWLYNNKVISKTISNDKLFTNKFIK